MSDGSRPRRRRSLIGDKPAASGTPTGTPDRVREAQESPDPPVRLVQPLPDLEEFELVVPKRLFSALAHEPEPPVASLVVPPPAVTSAPEVHDTEEISEFFTSEATLDEFRPQEEEFEVAKLPRWAFPIAAAGAIAAGAIVLALTLVAGYAFLGGSGSSDPTSAALAAPIRP